ncbi:voltage-gated potassium channel [Conyzicola nivalis]|uniref:Voltage-gated potassium channel n=1 Tax=Conyzicola nivalis TaxID=1477021 RepID=A0ABV2QNQ5_9MICO
MQEPPKPRAADAASAPAARWNSGASVPLILLGVTFIVSYSILVLVEDLPTWVRVLLWSEIVFTWLAFATDYVLRLVWAGKGNRGRFVAKHPNDLLSVFFPLFRAFWVLRLMRGMGFFRGRSGAAVRAQVVIYALVYTTTFMYVIALAALQAERDAPGATITTFGDAIWWACVTVATVGYGDTYPVTSLGRIYAVVLMIGGVAIVGTSSATVFSYISERVRSHGDGAGGGRGAADAGGPADAGDGRH